MMWIILLIERKEKMLFEFKPIDTINIDVFEDFNNELKSVLESIDDETLFSDNHYTQDEFTALLQSFVEGQRGSLGRTKEGSWSIAPNDDYMPTDCRVAYIFQPTYLVTAILSRVKIDFPEIARSIPRYDVALKKGLLFCSYRGLYGHGYEADEEAAEALTILSVGKVPLLLESDRNLCPELLEAIQNVTKSFQYRLMTNTTGSWGGNLQESFSSALETFYIKNDKEMYETIKSTDKNSAFIKEKDLKW